MPVRRAIGLLPAELPRFALCALCVERLRAGIAVVALASNATRRGLDRSHNNRLAEPCLVPVADVFLLPHGTGTDQPSKPLISPPQKKIHSLEK